MAKTKWQDPKTSEIRSTHISGLQEAIGKLEESIDMDTVVGVGIPLLEVYISANDRYRIYQAPEGQRNWVSYPAPVVKKNNAVITLGFEIDYGGGGVIFDNPLLGGDTVTVDATYTVANPALVELLETEINTHKLDKPHVTLTGGDIPSDVSGKYLTRMLDSMIGWRIYANHVLYMIDPKNVWLNSRSENVCFSEWEEYAAEDLEGVISNYSGKYLVKQDDIWGGGRCVSASDIVEITDMATATSSWSMGHTYTNINNLGRFEIKEDAGAEISSHDSVGTALRKLSDSKDLHQASAMPHEFTDQRDGKKYRFGLQVSAEGSPQLIYEEVTA